MNKIVIILLLFVFNITLAQMPSAVSGKIVRLENFSSSFVQSRNIDIWLPQEYSSNKKYAVLYMQDGQGLYDASVTWNHQSWEVDDVISELQSENKIKDVIVVGIWNAQNLRHPEYFPQKPYESLSQVDKDTITAQLQRYGRTNAVFTPISDAYLKFLVTELKPYIDKNYATLTDKENTYIAGSSMGGLISMYAICEYPNVFGGAACLSTHWPGSFTLENNPMPNAFVNYLSNHLPNPKSHKIYFDYGDMTLDAMYAPLQQKVDVVMQKKGYSKNNWITEFFPGDNHSEVSWHKRFHIPLLFLLGKKKHILNFTSYYSTSQ